VTDVTAMTALLQTFTDSKNHAQEAWSKQKLFQSAVTLSQRPKKIQNPLKHWAVDVTAIHQTCG
jgi:hypothetical protein